jgi:lipase
MVDASWQRVPVAGGELTVTVWGDLAAGPPALAVHGITGSSMAWAAVAARLPGPLVAPDLRGRGGSNELGGPYGMVAHAADCAAVLDALSVDRATVVGHSMGGFVASVFAHRHPDRVAKLVLVDGGIPLSTPDGDLDALLGPAAARLRMRFPDRAAYHEFWRQHPAFTEWNATIESYVDYDLVPAGTELRSRVAEEAMRADFLDMYGDTARDAAAALPVGTPFLRAERGLLDEPVPLYPDPAALDRVAVRTIAGTNHYSILFSDTGAAAVAAEL